MRFADNVQTRWAVAASLLTILFVVAFFFSGCSTDTTSNESASDPGVENVDDRMQGQEASTVQEPSDDGVDEDGADKDLNGEGVDPSASDADDGAGSTAVGATAAELKERIGIHEDFRTTFDHGPKPAQYQKYIVLHDTEGDSSPSSVIDWWDGNGNLVAAHFVIGRDGAVYQCAPLDSIVHHAGFGDTGHNAAFSVEDESRDDKKGTTPIGSWAADYGMNSYSIGIELVHVGGGDAYPKAQLEALDELIAYIDAHYGFESQIIDHKAWRSGNSDTSVEFAPYLANYQDHRTHD